MDLRTIARVFGIIYLLVGVLGFIPALDRAAPDASPLIVGSTSYLLGLFPVNVLHNLVHVLIGAFGILAAGTFAASRTYFRSLAVIYGLLTILGLIPATNTVFGLVPLFSNDIWLHAVTAIAAAYFGWKAI